MTFDREHWQYAALTNRGSGRVQRAVVGIHFHDDLYYRRFPQGNISDYTYSRSLIEDRYYSKGQSDARFAPIDHGEHGGGGGDHQDSDHYDAFYTESESDLRYARLLHDHPYSPITHTHSNTASWFIHDHIHNHHYDDIDGHPDFYTQDQSNSRFARIDHDSEHDDRFARIEHDSSHDDRFARIEHDTAHDDRFARINHDSSHDDRFYTKSIADARFAPIDHGEHGGGSDGDFSDVGHSHTVNVDPDELDYAEPNHTHPGFTDPTYWTTDSNASPISNIVFSIGIRIEPLRNRTLFIEATHLRANEFITTPHIANLNEADLGIRSSIIPGTATRFDIGSVSYPWRDLYTRDLSARSVTLSDFDLGNVASDTHTHTGPGGTPTEHDHDLRYYTETESDIRYVNQSDSLIVPDVPVSVLTNNAFIRASAVQGLTSTALSFIGREFIVNEGQINGRLTVDTFSIADINVASIQPFSSGSDINITATLHPSVHRGSDLGNRFFEFW